MLFFRPSFAPEDSKTIQPRCFSLATAMMSKAFALLRYALVSTSFLSLIAETINMRYCNLIILSLLALDLSHAFQQSSIGLARQRRQHWAPSSTKLDFTTSIGDVDPALIPALTASASLFIGAAGTLLYNRLATEKKQEPLPPSPTVDDVKQLQANVEAVIPSLEEQVKAEEELMEFQAEIQQVLMEADAAIETAQVEENVPTALLESLQKTNNGKTASSTDAAEPTDGKKVSVPLSNDNVAVDSNGESVATAKEPSFISILESSNDDEETAYVEETQSAEPSFSTSLQSSAKTVVDTESIDEKKEANLPPPNVSAASVPDVPSTEAKNLQSSQKVTTPSFIAPPQLSSTTISDLKPNEEENDVVSPAMKQAPGVLAGLKSSQQATTPSFISSTQSSSKTTSDGKPTEKPVEKDMPVTKQPIIAGQATDTTLASNGQPLQTTAASKPVASTTKNVKETNPQVLNDVARKVPQEAATSFRIKPRTVKDMPVEKMPVAAQPTARVSSTAGIKTKETSSGTTIPATSAKVPVSETVSSASSMPAASTVNTAVRTTQPVAKKEVVSATATTPQASSPPIRPQSTKDIMKSISSTPTMTRSNGNNSSVATKPRATINTQQIPRQPVKASVAEYDDIGDDYDDDSLKTSLSMLSRKEPPPGLEEDYETAMNSLHQHIQDQARDMTRKRMDEKVGFMTDGDVPAFIAPTETGTKVATRTVSTSPTTISSDAPTTGQDTVTSTSSSSSDEQVAKMLKKSNSSRLKRARKSVVLVALTTGVVVVGKRLAALLIGRGML